MIAAALLDRFGAQALYGRTLGFGEARRILLVAQIIESYRERNSAQNWAGWTAAFPEKSRLLNWVCQVAEDANRLD